jgi:hypothetical protein
VSQLFCQPRVYSRDLGEQAGLAASLPILSFLLGWSSNKNHQISDGSSRWKVLAKEIDQPSMQVYLAYLDGDDGPPKAFLVSME